jgi:tRNA(adenine34) deaminase
MRDSEREFQFVSRCNELARQARAHGEAAVGAVIVREGRVVAEAMEQVLALHDVTAHAELMAIRFACRSQSTLDLSSCTLYTIAEPCGMCSFAIREAGIRRVVIGRAIEEIGGATSRFPILTDCSNRSWGPPPDVICGEWPSLSDEK